MAEEFTLTARGPFSLAAGTRFLEGFTPAGFTGTADEPLELAFPVEGDRRTAGVRVREHAHGVTAEIVSPAAPAPGLAAAIRSQVTRILSLDVDGSGFPAVGDRDPVVAGLQRHYPGLRPVGFWSPYEAAAWAVIGQRIRIRQAAAIKSRMARELGEPVSFGEHVVHAFPSPQRLAGLDGFTGLSGRKPEWLRSIARAALDGHLDATHLRALPRDEALAELTRLPGIGGFSAELILLRGAGDPDHIPLHEGRLPRAVALAYGLPEPPSAEELQRLSQRWKPYRTWVTLLLRARLEDETGEISGAGRVVSADNAP
ncbi:DNA-3-methyladenine glycosylase [Actinoallomurus oryzae]|uniref:DNA-3-methyladenine glycosylase II n=1 Tax=Actinoallomurus oryzae TaxID=502180 RepID=A0ABP8Q9I8_9ACTN